jgi:hypothetical protein
MTSRYDRLRRVIAPIALLVAIGVLARETCRAEEDRDVRFVVELDERIAEIRHLRVDLWQGDRSVGYFETRFGEAGATGPVRFTQPVPADLEATIAVTYADGTVTPVRERVQAPAGTQVILRGP